MKYGAAMKLRGSCLAAAVVLICSTASAQPSWKDRQRAAQLTQQGKILVKKGEVGEAADKFREADQLSPAPSVKLELARMLLALAKLREAKEVAEACIADKPQQWMDKKAQKDCETLLVEVGDRTPTLALSVFEPEASKVAIEVDGEPGDTGEPTALDPGEHTVVATAEGYLEYRETFTLKEGERKALEITMTKATAEVVEAPAEKEASGGLSPIPAYISWGVGAVGLGLGVGFGIAAIQSTNDVLREYGCEDDVCPEAAADDLETAKLNGNVSTAGFVIGFAGILTGTILFVFSDVVQGEESDAPEAARVLPVVGPGYLGVAGSF
jgi:hypothetical protein